MQTPSLSVIIPTYQGEHRVLRTLNSLQNQRMKDFEVIVVVDGSTDNTYAAITSESWSFSLEVINQQNKGRAGARNSGVKISRADFVVFLDDDIVFDESLLERYWQLANEGHGIVIGAAYSIATSSRREFYQYSLHLNEKWSTGIQERGFVSKPYFNAQNSMVRKSVLAELGMFDERLRDCEDLCLAIKIFERGQRIFIDPAILVGHHIHPDFRTYGRRVKEYENARGVLLQIYPAAAKYISMNRSAPPFKAFLYTLFSSGLFIQFADWGVFRFLPRNFRFRLYDFLLTAHSTVA